LLVSYITPEVPARTTHAWLGCAPKLRAGIDPGTLQVEPPSPLFETPFDVPRKSVPLLSVPRAPMVSPYERLASLAGGFLTTDQEAPWSVLFKTNLELAAT
jgi:hypothetical protein